MANTIYVSQDGLEALNRRLQKANEELVAIRAEKSVAYTQTGDTWHDNPTFNKLEQDEKRKAEAVGEISNLVANAQVFSFEKRNTSRVQLGSIVHINRYYAVSGEDDELVWEITGYGETNVPQKRVAYNAPMAQEFMGLHVGETAKSGSPKGPVEYEILALFSSWEEVPEPFKRA